MKTIRETPKAVWEWDVFGCTEGADGTQHYLMIVQLPFEVPHWRRLLTQVLLGSNWKRL